MSTPGSSIMVTTTTSTATTYCDSNLCTCWHNTGEINTNTRVQPGSIRQSRRDKVGVAIADTDVYYDSFVYEAIPRNGNGSIYSPGNSLSIQDCYSEIDDGISIEPIVGINMARSQFEYNQDVDVKIHRTDGTSLGSASNVIVRPISIHYNINSSNDGGIVIRVPKDPNSRKFSVEFNDDLCTYRSNGKEYVSSGGDVVGVESTNALLIFASPFIPSEFVPNLSGGDARTMKPGPINESD